MLVVNNYSANGEVFCPILLSNELSDNGQNPGCYIHDWVFSIYDVCILDHIDHVKKVKYPEKS